MDIRPVRRWLERVAATGDPAVRADAPREIRESYYDTGDWRLYRSGLTLLVRDAETRQAISAPLSDEIAVAEIVETLEPDGSPDGCQGPIGDRVRAVATQQPLEELFTAQRTLQEFRLTTARGATATVGLVETRLPLAANEPPVRFSRVRIAYEPAADPLLRNRIEALKSECGLRPSTATDHEAALLALGIAPPAPPDLGPTTIDPTMTTSQVAFANLRRQFAKCRVNDPGTRIGEDIERLHDMRVSTRRMRAAMQIYEPFLPATLLRLQKEIRWLGQVLGEVRDLDVHLEQIDAWGKTVPPSDLPTLDAVRKLLQQQRKVARTRMLRSLNSRRHQRLIERMTALLQHGPTRRLAVASPPILSVAPGLIEQRLAEVRRRADRIRRRSPARKYHKLRIHCKRLRYALEFHSEIYGKRAAKVIRPLVGLQDLLGEHQDADVGAAWMRELVVRQGRKLPAPTVFVMGALAERHRRRAVKLRRRFPETYGKLQGKALRELKSAMRKAATK